MTLRRLAELRVALLLLTRLPAGRIAGPAPGIAAAAWAFPLCGALVGALSWGGYAIAAALGLPAAVSAVLALGVGVAATGGLHEDGLADLADGLGGGQDRAGKLAIMRDSRVGSFGVLALVLVILLKAASIAGLASAPALLPAFVATGAVSRGAMLLALRTMPAARPDGLGRMAGRPGGVRICTGLALTLAALLPLGVAALALVLVTGGAGAALAALARRQLGGQTGDALGALQCVTETAGWLALAAVAA